MNKNGQQHGPVEVDQSLQKTYPCRQTSPYNKEIKKEKDINVSKRKKKMKSEIAHGEETHAQSSVCHRLRAE